jgi:transposase
MSVQPDTDHQSAEPSLFADLPAPSAEQVAQAQAKELTKRGSGLVRLLKPDRLQVELRASDLESLLPEDHRARLVWGYVALQDLSKLVEAVKARGSNAGRAAIDPRVLFALWLYATLEGVGSGREVARLTTAHDAYRWVCGGVSVNYHALNDFRSSNEALMDELLTVNVAALAACGAISLERVAQDGMRVRADAGAASFRREARLEEHLDEAGELVRTLKAQAKADPGEGKRREQAARLRGAQDREARIKAALAQLPEVAATKKRNGGKAEEARASTTDPDARVMKMADGGYRPAVNVQFATTCEDQVIVGMGVVNAGSDMAQLVPMVEQVQERLGQSPKQWMVDGGYPAHGQLDAVSDKTVIYAPVPEPKIKLDEQGKPLAPTEDKYAAKPSDSVAVAQWRERMASPEAREAYRQRAATAECVNAHARNRGMLRMPVRGLAKMRSVVGLFVLAHNLLRAAVLAPHLVGWGIGASAMAVKAA